MYIIVQGGLVDLIAMNIVVQEGLVDLIPMNVIVQGGLVDLIPMNVIVQGGLVDLIPMNVIVQGGFVHGCLVCCRVKWGRVKCEPGNVVFFLEGLRIFDRVGSNVRVRAVLLE